MLHYFDSTTYRSYMMEIIKKCLDDVEEDLRCPVCFELPKDVVRMCVQGHHVCKNCSLSYLNNIPDCPTCRSAFNGTTNYLIKNICTHIQKIKEVLPRTTEFYDLNHNQASYTDDKVSTTFSKKKLISKAKFSCLIRFCDEKLDKKKLLQHVRHYHEINLIEDLNKSEMFTYCWIIKHEFDKIFDRAINVSGMGLFFFNVRIHANGHLYGSIQMGAGNNKARCFNYILDLTCESRSLRYEGKVGSCQVVGGYDLHEKMTFFVNNAELAILLNTGGIFNCNLMLYRRKRQKRKSSLNEPAEAACTNYISSILKNCLHFCDIILNRPESFYMMILIIIFILLSFTLQIYVSFLR